MGDSPEQIISELLTDTIGEYDIPAHLQVAAESVYGDVGSWLEENLPDKGGWHVYPQGSMRLGTVVRPTLDDEYDIDAVATLHVGKDDIDKQELKTTVGDALKSYLLARDGTPLGPTGIKEGGRCWTLLFDEPFHMDMLPGIPNDDAKPSGIWITDRKLFRWQPSNPIAFADWFYDRMGSRFLDERTILAKRAQVDIDEIPAWRVRTTLQRVVQALKVHRNAYFAAHLEDRPPSVIVTTLAAHAYSGDRPLFDAVMDTAANLPRYIERDSGLVVVTNPVQPDENFADRWGADPGRVEDFYGWIGDLQRTMEEARDARGGLNVVASRLEKGFGYNAVRKAVMEFGTRRSDERAAGRLAVAGSGAVGAAAAGAATLIRPHTFHGA